MEDKLENANLIALFGTPVFSNIIDVSHLKDNFKKLEYVRNDAENGYITTDKDVLSLDDFSNLKTAIEENIEYYVREVLFVNADIDFYVTTSWVNKHAPGDKAQEHDHVNSLISGIVYLECPVLSGDVIFHKDRMLQNLFPRSTQFDFTALQPWNTEAWRFTPNAGDIVLFPSILTHSVMTNKSFSDRYSLAFNCYAKGELGKNNPTSKVTI